MKPEQADSRHNYAFRDNASASQRLDTLDEMFGESSREFVSTYPNRGTKLALDLGCGPGHTTRLLAESLRAQRTVGVDQSEVYVQNARARYPNLEFQSLDVTREMPLPPANVIYARFLLSHLPDPLEQVVHWSRHLALIHRSA